MGRKGLVKETPAPNRLGDYTGRHFVEGISRFRLQLRGRQEPRKTHTDGVGMELACGLGFKSRGNEYVFTLLGPQSRFGDNWGHITWNLSALPPKRDWSSKGVKR